MQKLVVRWPAACAAFSALTVVAFVVFYAVAAALYPGGTHVDPDSEGFSFVHNYWSDLLHDWTRHGRPNPAGPVARAAMVTLSAGLLALWFAISGLAERGSLRAAEGERASMSGPGSAHVEKRVGPRVRGLVWFVRVAGSGAVLAMPLVATDFHDRAIHLASLLGVLAFVASLGLLWQRSDRAFRITAVSAIVLVAVNYVIWQSRTLVVYLPLLQKFAFIVFLLWMLLAARLVIAGVLKGRRSISFQI